MPNSINSVLINIDYYGGKYVPIGGTVINLVDIVLKAFLDLYCSETTVKENRYFTYLQDKSYYTCLKQLIPFADMFEHHEDDCSYKQPVVAKVSIALPEKNVETKKDIKSVAEELQKEEKVDDNEVSDGELIEKDPWNVDGLDPETARQVLDNCIRGLKRKTRLFETRFEELKVNIEKATEKKEIERWKGVLTTEKATARKSFEKESLNLTNYVIKNREAKTEWDPAVQRRILKLQRHYCDARQLCL